MIKMQSLAVVLISHALISGCASKTDLSRLENQVRYVDQGSVQNSEMLRSEIVELRRDLRKIAEAYSVIKNKTDRICIGSQDGVDMLHPC